MGGTAVIVPTYNEAGNIADLASRLLALEPAIKVVIVDDDSPDGTGEAAERIAEESDRFHVIHRAGPRGYAAASREGMLWALERDYDLVCTMDADLSHDPEVLPRMAARARSGAGVVIGSRYTEGGELDVRWGPLRRALSRCGSAYARWALGSRVRDCTSGFRCYRREALERVDLGSLRSEGYTFLVELLAALLDSGATVAEEPITYVDRHSGRSKISRAIVLEALIRTTALALRRRSRPTP